jgi:hypothetical protein
MKKLKFTTKPAIALYAMLAVVFLCGCGRTNIEDIHNCIILKQHCGFDNLDAGFYQVKDLKTGVVKRIDVDIRDCDVYNVGDTIR